MVKRRKYKLHVFVGVGTDDAVLQSTGAGDGPRAGGQPAHRKIITDRGDSLPPAVTVYSRFSTFDLCTLALQLELNARVIGTTLLKYRSMNEGTSCMRGVAG
eukprot:COSAG02_NODE_37_length_48203_cov_57.745708_1_plen_102_part_00